MAVGKDSDVALVWSRSDSAQRLEIGLRPGRNPESAGERTSGLEFSRWRLSPDGVGSSGVRTLVGSFEWRGRFIDGEPD